MRIWTDNPQFDWLVEPTMPKALMGCFDGDGGDGGGSDGGEQGPGFGDGGGADPSHGTAGAGAGSAGNQGGDDAGSQFGGHDPGSIGDRGTGTHAGGPGDTGTGPDDAGGGDDAGVDTSQFGGYQKGSIGDRGTGTHAGGPGDTGTPPDDGGGGGTGHASWTEAHKAGVSFMDWMASKPKSTSKTSKSAPPPARQAPHPGLAPTRSRTTSSTSRTSRSAPAQSKPAPRSFTRAQELAAIALGWPEVKSWDDLGKLAAIEKDNKALGTYLGMLGIPGWVAKKAMGMTPGSKTSATWADILSGKVPEHTRNLAEAVGPNLMNKDSTVGIGPLDTPFDFDQYAATEAAIDAYQETGDREKSYQAYVDHMTKAAQDEHFDRRMEEHKKHMAGYTDADFAGPTDDEKSHTPPAVDTTPPSGGGTPGGGSSSPGGGSSSGGGSSGGGGGSPNASDSYYGDYLVPTWGRYLPQNGLAPNRRAEIGG